MEPQAALADLKQISVQIVNALVATREGDVLASTIVSSASSERLARSAAELWDAADRARRDLGRDALAQLEAATPEGSVFVVRDDERSIVATTGRDPTVGLIFYDLKTCLRSVAEGATHAADAAPAPEPKRTPAADDKAKAPSGEGEKPAGGSTASTEEHDDGTA